MFAEVALDRNTAGNGIWTYQVPKTLEGLLQPGQLVTVPLGKSNTQATGYVVGLKEQPAVLSVPEKTIAYKELSEELPVATMLTPELVELALWVSEYYMCPCYYVLEYMLPKLAKNKSEMVLVWNPESDWNQLLLLDEETGKIAEELREKGSMPIFKWQKQHAGQMALLDYLIAEGLVWKQLSIREQDGIKEEYRYDSCVSREQLTQLEPLFKRATVQWEILRYLTLEGGATAKELKQYWNNYSGAVKELLRKQYITRQKTAVPRFHTDAEVFRNEESLILNAEQSSVVETILQELNRDVYRSILIHGVTGSGKTEVYLRALKYALQQGKGAIVLVPEIALTPQLIGRFRAVLGETVEVFHSNMSDGERHDTWKRLFTGESRVVIGVRSAVFAPVQRLGLIIVDEEHESTYKQSEPDPRYHAVRVAQHRMKRNSGVLLLGSATPSMESYDAARRGDMMLLEMEHRATAHTLPEVEIVDMTREFRQGNRSIFSGALRERIEESLKQGEQVILFLNRRGFSSAVVCRECGHTLTCEKCSIALTYHRGQEVAKCHYCDFRMPVPKSCPNCGSRFIRYMGTGTELVEEEVKKQWPWVMTDRMDLDTTKNKNAHGEILERFAKGETQILIGTQMVTKGLNFPNVTTVGVMMADMTLNLPDYTASERTFQLVTQVAGRAGRGNRPGHVVVQTYAPEHYSLQNAARHDYKGFYEKEIQNRELMGYAPFSTMIRVLVSDFSDREIPGLMQEMAKEVYARFKEVELLGPSEAPISMIRKRYRYHLILKGTDRNRLREAAVYCEKFLNISRKSKTLRIIIDVEPQSVL